MLLNKAIDAGLRRWVENIKKQENLPVRLVLWNGSQIDLGAFKTPEVTLEVKSPAALPLLVSPTLESLGEAYIQEKIDIGGKLADVIRTSYRLAELSARKSGASTSGAMRKLAGLTKHFKHTKAEDKDSIQYHYDVSNDFYKLWLDPNLVYSCAYFENGDEDLETAQNKKIDHILTKIRLQPGQTLLDIGCGWGALVIRAASKFGARCVGITLSQNQHDLAVQRVRAAGLEGQIEIRLQDYRDVKGTFDRITSVGMFEHVGRINLVSYFSRINELLAEEGVAMNHGITSTDPESRDSPMGGGDFIDRYVFPKGELPHISLALSALQQGGLEALDVENLRRHYARTLEMWAASYEKYSEQIRELVGEKRYRIWRVYLAGCAHAFEVDDVSIYQVICQKAGRKADAIPWSRRYIYGAK
ncbi:MAG TPA: cyclopropane-fatty-acyl-phospholipid synthase family protein [Herbaspirillum sp.]|nr:cyclopropane-fatty-acyl-phospholipid synthase family protein [Herbaspirillum sp.]